MTPGTAAEILGLGPSSMSRYLTSGRLKAAKYGREWNINPNDLHEFFTQDWAPGADWRAFLNYRLEEVKSQTAKSAIQAFLAA